MIERPEFPRTGQNKEIPNANERRETVKIGFQEQRRSFFERIKSSMSMEQQRKLPKFPSKSEGDVRDQPENNLDRLGDNLF